MSGAVSIDWRVRQLAALVPTWRAYKVRLYTAGPTPSPSDRWFDYTEPKGAWYAPQLLADLGQPAPNESGQAQVTSAPHVWTLGEGDSPVTILGGWISDERGRFVMAQPLVPPVSLGTPGAFVAITVALTY